MREYDLSGEWKFGLEPDLLNDVIMLPGTMAQAHKGEKNNKRETGYLTEKYQYSGKAYYEKWVYLHPEEVGRPVFLCLERTRMTRVWVNGILAGYQESLTTPHIYELTDYIATPKVRILIEVDNANYPIAGGHLTSPDTQTNWNGIIGKIRLTVYDHVRFGQVRTFYQHIDGHYQVSFRYRLYDTENEFEGKCKITPVTIKRLSDDGKPEEKEIEEQTQDFDITVRTGENVYENVYTFVHEPQLWSEYTPVVYRFRMEIEGWTVCEVETGLREFEARDHYFYINGNRTMLRGKHDALLFPIEGAVPASVEEWLKVMGIAKEYGVNHYRFHTCCPPDAAFEAADLLGIYMEPELPFWGTVPEESGEDKQEGSQWEYLLSEGLRMLETFGNHPSFCMMSMGNELWGSKKRIGKAIQIFRKADNRHLYTQGSNNFQFVPEILPEEDFYVGVRLAAAAMDGKNDRLIRGSYACCDAPMGHVQTRIPSTTVNYDSAIMPQDGRWKPQIPVVLHEIGQYEMYPDYHEIESYTGVLKPANLEIFRERLYAQGMGEEAEEFFYNSGMLALQCYEEELEAAHRSEYVAGYQILDLQDYTGQGTALVGILNAFMESKGLISAKEWRNYCSDSVLLAEFDDYCVESGSIFRWKTVLSHYRWVQPADEKWQINWEIYIDGEMMQRGKTPLLQGGCGVLEGADTSWQIPQVTMPTVMELWLSLEQTGVQKGYRLWLYPDNRDFVLTEGRITDMTGQREAYVTRSGELASEYFRLGKRVLLIEENPREWIQGMYCTDFWNFPMFRSISESKGVDIPVGTLGLLIRNTHPALAQFPSETYTSPQWYPIIEHSKCAKLLRWERMADRPLVQVIDNVERNDRLGILYEQKNEAGGLLLTSTTRLFEIQDCMQGRQYAKSLCEYILGAGLNRDLYQ